MKSSIFKLLSVITFACLLFPIINLIGVFVRAPEINDLGAIVKSGNIGYFGLIGAIAVSCICLLLANVFNTSNKGLAMTTVFIISGIATAAVLFATKTGILTDDIPRGVILFINNFFVGYVGFKAYSKDLTETLSKKKITAMTLIMLGALTVTFVKFSFMANEMLTSFIIALIACMFILNRSLLEGLYKRKSSDSTNVSKLVQKYNLFIIGGFTIVFVVLVFAKDFVAFLIRYGLELVGLGMLKMVQNANNASFNTVKNPDDNKPLDISSGMKFEANQYASQINSIMLYVAIFIGAIFLIVVLVKLIKYAPSKIQLFIQKIKEFFSRMMGLNQVGVKVSTSDYEDEVEDIDKGDLDDERRIKMLQNQRKVRSIKDPVERMRAFYGYFMSTLKKNNVPLFVSDTSYQIYDKSHLVCNMEDITKQVTEIYNQVRYNDIIPNDKMLENVDEYMTVITKNCKALKVEDKEKKNKKDKGRR